MMRRLHRFFLLSVPYALLAVVLLVRPAVAEEKPSYETALQRYVEKPDPSYSWQLVKTVEKDDRTTYVIDLKSQTWRTSEEVDRTLWEHWLLIVVPHEVKYDTAMLWIGGGNNNRSEPPNDADAHAAALAMVTGSIVADLRCVPNQPLDFGDGKGRTEDDLIAYTWDKFMTTGDETWPARLPMVKSAVRAMDTVQAFLASEEGGEREINRFVVAGGSKRGWTTWLTGAVDPRVTAIIPIVIDVVNVHPSMRHHHAVYGFWAPAVTDYVVHKITDRHDTQENLDLLKIEDPYSYLDRLKMPKYIVNATGDQFFVPDSSQFYWDDLQGEKYLRYVANGEHSLQGTDARESVAAFYQTVLDGTPRPKYTWTVEEDGAIRVETETKPLEVKLWQATNRFARDFRVDAIGRSYTSTPLEEQETGVYVGRVETPEKGFTAYLVELTYDVGAEFPLKLTTQVKVLPDVLPHEGKLEEALKRKRQRAERRRGRE